MLGREAKGIYSGMELFLNAVWLLLSAATLCLWLSPRRAPRMERNARGLIVLACALLLLFPVISMTDDIHAQQITIEDASATTKKIQKSAHRHDPGLHHADMPAVVLLSSPENPLWRVLGINAPDHSFRPIETTPFHASGRAPPVAS